MTQQACPTLVNRPSMIEYHQLRFLIMDAPTDSNLNAYIDVCKKKNVVCVVRACEPTYKKEPLVAAGIRVMELPFSDGDPPPEHMLEQWLSLIKQEFGDFKPGDHKKGSFSSNAGNGKKDQNGDSSHNVDADGVLGGTSSNKKTLAVHCVAGLGRAPVLVAVALIENGMEPFEAIAFIRKRRRGAINARQLKYIESYKPKSKGGSSGCIIC